MARLGTGGRYSIVEGGYKIQVFNAAYKNRADVNLDFTETPASWTNFTGVIIHELTHIAVLESPQILASYFQAQDEYGAQSLLGTHYGAPFVDDLHRAQELLAMTVAVSETNPTHFTQTNSCFLFFTCTSTDWRQEWLRQYVNYGRWYGKGYE